MSDSRFLILHPSREYELRSTAGVARWKWESAWRAYRVARREGYVRHLPLEQIAQRFEPKPLRGELGRIENLRIIRA